MPDNELELEDPTATASEEVVEEENEPVPNEETGDEPAPESTPEPESEDDPTVPTMVLDFAPSMAGQWADMSEDQQQGLMADLVRQIDQGDTEGESGDVDDTGEATESTQSEPSVETPDPAPAPFTIDPATEAELRAACEEMNVDIDGTTGKFLRKMMELSGHTLTSLAGIGREVGAYNDAIQSRMSEAEKRVQETDARVMSIADENKLVAAMEAHASDCRGMTKVEIAEVVENVKKLKESGRINNFHDAASFALWERKKIPAKPASTAARRATEKVASALSVGGRSRAAAGVAKLPKGLNTPSQIAQALMDEYEKTGKFR